MLDIQLLRKHAHEVAAALAKKGHNFGADAYLDKEAQRKGLQTELESLNADMNHVAKTIAQADKASKTELSRRAARIKERIKQCKAAFGDIKRGMDDMLMMLPNLPHDSVPAGDGDKDNMITRRWGAIKPLSFAPRDHVALAANLGLMDSEAAHAMSGGRYTVLYGDLAKLQRALTQFMMDVQIQEHGYREVYVPYIVRRAALEGTGQLPKFKHDLFAIAAKEQEQEQGAAESYLIPTAEVPLSNLLRDKIVPASDLPLKYVAHTPCFRSEAGNYGKDTHGIFRQHQFEKVELVQITKPEDSWRALEELTAHAEAILRTLGLPYRVVNLCGGDLGFAAAKTYDIEAWLPGQNQYREISSCSNMTDFQARRMRARFRRGAGSKPELAHTLNGSGLAVGRTLIAVLENCQDEKGAIHIPPPLRAYMRGQKIIA